MLLSCGELLKKVSLKSAQAAGPEILAGLHLYEFSALLLCNILKLLNIFKFQKKKKKIIRIHFHFRPICT